MDLKLRGFADLLSRTDIDDKLLMMCGVMEDAIEASI
jgi:hypothetical protein